MLNWVFSIMIILSIIFGIITGGISQVSNAVLDSGKSTAELFIVLIGSMAVWGGIMRIADKAGLTRIIAGFFRPAARLLFKGLDTNGKAFKAITMNITANLLGLGNAATPLGLEAMRSLEQEEKTTDTASRNMVMFAVLNSASIQIIPATVATLRLSYGSVNPLDVLPAVFLTSCAALAVGITMVFLFDFKGKGGGKN
ncbi:MAG: nucleoside recognition domain-containing protein [Oscillospiraceae bacterium]|jgi:spore maturation protein A